MSKKTFSHKPSSYGQSESGNSIYRHVVHASNNLTSTAGGVLDVSIALDPSSVSNNDWADFSSTYDEFRVIGIQIDMVSLGPAAPPATLANSLFVIAFDNDSLTAPGTLAQAMSYGTSSIHSVLMTHPNGKPFTKSFWRPTAGKETTVTWNDVANASGSLGAILIYASSLTASTTYFSYALRYFCEFRGRR